LADLQRTVYPHSGHPSSEGRAQDRVSSPAKDRRSANCVCVCMDNQGKGIQTTYWLMGRKGMSWFNDYVAWTHTCSSADTSLHRSSSAFQASSRIRLSSHDNWQLAVTSHSEMIVNWLLFKCRLYRCCIRALPQLHVNADRSWSTAAELAVKNLGF